MTGRIAIVLGATGLTGGLLVNELINDARYSKIKLFSRSKSEFNSPKIEEYLGDLLQLEDFKSDFTGDVIFCCIGTTKAKTKDQEKYKAIDYGIPLSAAKLAKENQIDTIIIVSALGANPNSSVFYNRTKGEMERDVLAQKVPSTYILQPSLITGNRSEKRGLEKFGAAVFKVLNILLIGPLKKYRSIEARSIARAMIRVDQSKPESQRIESDEIARLGS
ncbi:MAG: NAD(P)H-binding protein [Crocinitomicaceae bacterium]|nr:NAD(P)H-binding protein [Crocinitomicaceae bacterium]